MRVTKSRLNSEERKRVRELFAAMPPVKGETRVVYRCRGCALLHGHRFVPYGLGSGMTVDVCTCVLTGNSAYDKVQERTP